MKKAIISVLSALTGAAIGAGLTGKVKEESLKQANHYGSKHLEMFLMMNQWVRVKQKGGNLASFFAENNYKRIAIYGMGYAGETLIEELKGTDIEVAYGIDQKADSIFADIKVVLPDNSLDDVDAIVVTAITFFDEIEERLSKKVDCPILSLEDILYEM
ncbi:hypothetical protein IMSAGC005_00269 [Lachnospiraceae bacterium]|nr:hypothetical protein IMSAGC005_00269 [Lachnospiraceae bacterium]